MKNTQYISIESSSDIETFRRENIMKKAASILLATFTSTILATTAMAAIPAHQASHQVKTHHVAAQQQHSYKQMSLANTETSPKVEVKTAAVK